MAVVNGLGPAAAVAEGLVTERGLLVEEHGPGAGAPASSRCQTSGSAAQPGWSRKAMRAEREAMEMTTGNALTIMGHRVNAFQFAVIALGGLKLAATSDITRSIVAKMVNAFT